MWRILARVELPTTRLGSHTWLSFRNGLEEPFNGTGHQESLLSYKFINTWQCLVNAADNTRVRKGGQYYCGFVANLSRYLLAKNYRNRTRFDIVVTKVKWCNFWRHIINWLFMRESILIWSVALLLCDSWDSCEILEILALQSNIRLLKRWQNVPRTKAAINMIDEMIKYKKSLYKINERVISVLIRV